MGEENEQPDNGNNPESGKEFRQKFEQALSDNKALREQLDILTEKQLWSDAGLNYLTDDHKVAVKAVVGQNDLTVDVVKEKAQMLGFVKEEQPPPPPNPNPAPYNSTDNPTFEPGGGNPLPFNPALSVIDQINAASDMRSTIRQTGKTGDDFLDRLRASKSQGEAMAIIRGDNGRHGLLADDDIE